MKTVRLVVIFFMVVGLISSAFGEEVKRTGKIVDIRGRVEVEHGGGDWVPAQVGMILNEGDILKTAAKAWAFLTLDGGETATVEVEVEENSRLLLSELILNEEKGIQKTLLDLAIGKILITAQKMHSEGSKFEVKTPTSIVGVRGTTFAVEVEALE